MEVNILYLVAFVHYFLSSLRWSMSSTSSVISTNRSTGAPPPTISVEISSVSSVPLLLIWCISCCCCSSCSRSSCRSDSVPGMLSAAEVVLSCFDVCLFVVCLLSQNGIVSLCCFCLQLTMKWGTTRERSTAAVCMNLLRGHLLRR